MTLACYGVLEIVGVIIIIIIIIMVPQVQGTVWAEWLDLVRCPLVISYLWLS